MKGMNRLMLTEVKSGKERNSPPRSKKSRPPAGRNRLGSQIWANRTAYLMLLPCLASLLLFHYLPMFGLQIAFRSYNIAYPLSQADWVGFEYFRQFFQSSQFWLVAKNTLIVSFITLVLGYPLPILLALLLNELRSVRFKRVMQTATYMPYFVSTVISVSLVMTIFSPSGVMNGLVRLFDPGQTIIFMQEPGWFRPIYFFLGIWRYTGFDSIVFVGAMAAIDPQLYEAAVIDGAGRLNRMWHVTFKSILPTAAIMLILKVGKILNLMWQEILLLQNDLNISVSEVIQTFVYKRGILGADYSFSTAVGLCTSVLSLVMILATNHITKRMSDREVSIF